MPTINCDYGHDTPDREMMKRLQAEEWRPIAGFEGFCEVGDQGRVRTLDRVVPHHRGSQLKHGRVLRLQTADWRYGTRTRFARRFGVTPATIWNVRTGRTWEAENANN